MSRPSMREVINEAPWLLRIKRVRDAYEALIDEMIA